MIQGIHLRIGYRLALAFGTLLALLTILAWLALDRMHGLAEAFDELAGRQLETLALTAEIGADADVSARKLLLLMSAPRTQRVSAYAEIDAAHRKLDTAMDRLESRLIDPERQIKVQEVKARLIEYRLAYRDTVDFIEADDLDAARRTMAEQTDDALTLLAQARESLALSEQTITSERAKALDAQLQHDRNIVLALCLTALAAGSLFAAAVTRSIVRPLGRAEATAQRIARGEYTSRVEVTTHDEVGRVSIALNTLAEAVREREVRLLELANTDVLTGLAQRTRFVIEGAAVLQAARERGGCTAMLCFDIDRLKTINAILGFDAGDAVITDAAQRLAAVLGANTSTPGSARLARLAGGTFAALVPVKSATAAQALATELRREVEHKVAWDGQALDLSITAGLALCPEHANTVESLLRNAEQALFEAKRTHSGFAVYAPSLEAARMSHLSLLSDLQEAIDDGQLRQFLQPKLTPTGELRGVEALVRWRHPERGWVQPVDFIPFAERTGRIRGVTDWMLGQAVQTLARWQLDGIELTIAVNVSTQDVQDTTLPQRVQQLLAQHGVAPDRLQIELTETGLMEGGPEPIGVLHALREIGVWLAIDDFGTGHSSLAYLQSLPMNELKVDRTFVRDLNLDERRRELLDSIVKLGHSLGLKVTAEGAETSAELAVLAASRCDLVQGYVFAKPMDTPAFEAWHRERETELTPV